MKSIAQKRRDRINLIVGTAVILASPVIGAIIGTAIRLITA
jgi:hypothetical protein